MSADGLQAFEDFKRVLVTDHVLQPLQPLRPYCVKSDPLLFGLAVVWALKTFEMYTYGVHTTVETDHNCLRWLNTISIQNPRLTRWSLALQKYDIAEVKYKKAIMHTDCDGLSFIMSNV